MTILDTNVVSELMRQEANNAVLDWMDAQSAEELLLTAITAAEILHGIARLPDGKRKAGLREAADATLKTDFAGRILSFDEEAAEHYGQLVSVRERIGRPINMADALIAAICLSYGASLATRNVGDFEGLGLELVNPWEATENEENEESSDR